MLKIFQKRKSAPRYTPYAVPVPDPFENPMVETHPGQLRKWAEGLPVTNQQQLAEALATSLSRLNRFPGQVKRREELMEIYLAPACRVCHQYAEQKNLLSGAVKRQLMQELVYGYLHLVNSCLHEQITDKQRSRLAASIYCALKFTALEYLFACEEYDCRNTTTRKEVMRLYTLAEDLDLHHLPQDDPEQPIATIAHLSKLVLLLSLLDPCHLQQGEIHSIYHYLNQFADVARFAELDASVEPGGHYVIDRLGEVPSQLMDPETLDGLETSRFCLFDVMPISQRLHQHLRIIEQPNGITPTALENLTPQAAANLIRRMLKSWHIRAQRDSERHATTGQVKLILGIEGVHRHLSGLDHPDAISSGKQDSIELTLDACGVNRHTHSTEQALDSWRANQSRSGVALCLRLPLLLTPKVGDLALIVKPDNGKRDDLKIAIIRRALRKDGSVLEIGLQFLSGKIIPLSIQALDPESEQPPVNLPALYIDLGGYAQNSLLVNKGQMRIGCEYRVEEMTPAPVIKPVHLAEATAKFERYRIIRV